MSAEQEHVQTVLERLACFVHGVYSRHGNTGEIGVRQTPQGRFEGAWCCDARRHSLTLLRCHTRRGLA